ncbi:hypothetical protein [uncultured Vibrio sp.]|uniref:hypothetical protein n=1 Tax=uncultured Vibrio sp. TaxID=114054 RepID=UPI0026328BD2|nr:hypothetical protein [uncultured Vibrio sp.]
MQYTIKDAVKQLAFESNDQKGRLDALSFILQVMLDKVKHDDMGAYQDIKRLCLDSGRYSRETMMGIGDKDIEEQVQAFVDEIENIFSDSDDAPLFQDLH